MSVGDTAVAKLIEPIYSFDRVVIPAGAEVLGRVTQLDPAPKLVRIQSILNGDFTPLHRARVEFTTILLPNGRSILIHTISSEGLPTLYSPPKPDTKKKTAKPDPAPQPADDSHAADAHQDPIHGLLNLARQQGKQQIKAEIKSQIDSHTYGLGSVVRGPNKKERLEDLLISRLPYHPQWYRKSTRFDAVLSQPISFGTVALPAASLQQIGSRAELDRAVEVRFLSTISSGTARRGDPVEAVLSTPLFSADHKLLLPQGTHLTGTVRGVKPARWLHRTGKLRFTFDRVELPDALATALNQPDPPLRSVNVRLENAETDPDAHIKIDSEGSAKATESKKRLLAPAIATLVAMKSMDNDTGKTSASARASGNGAGRALGGFSGFGMVGLAAGRISSTAGSALGMYGMAFSVYDGIVTRGHEVEFDKNTSMVVRFGPRPAPAAAKK